MVDELEVTMSEGTKIYKSATLSVFKEPIQAAFLEADKKAIAAGFDLKKNSLHYTMSTVNDEWVIVLLVFKPGFQIPDEFIVCIPSD